MRSFRRPHTTAFFFFFNDTATTEIYTLSLHDALPIFLVGDRQGHQVDTGRGVRVTAAQRAGAIELDHYGTLSGSQDRKSTRLNSSHLVISYAVFCLKKKKKKPELTTRP